MPLFMDVHENIPAGTTAADVAGAHEQDVKVGRGRGVEYRSYWLNEESGTIFCLVEAPDAEAAVAVHRDAHGLVADRIVPVVEG
jgi:Protein of unknown function (DUF4242)